MKCPKCEMELVTKTRTGVEIEQCPSCKGIWLDKGELEKLIQREEDFYDDDDDDDDRRKGKRSTGQRIKDFFEDMFD